MPGSPFSDFLLSYGVHPMAFIGALIVSSGITSAIACLVLRDDTPRRS